ncbi:MAG: phosphate uptake regulator PhoU [Candidatus Micrarchaeota archaeon]
MDLPRRIQVTGRNTFIVSLPHGWVSKMNISKGDAAYISQNGDGSLTLSLKQSEKELKTVALEVSTTNRSVSMRNIVSAYVGGAGKIILHGKDMHTIAEEARRVLSGVEITDEEGDELTLKILTFDDVQIDNIMKREFNVTASMFNLAISAFKNGGDNFTEVARKEDEVDRLYLLLLRTLCLGTHKSSESIFQVITAKSMEKVSDHLVDICSKAKDCAPDERVAGLLEKVMRMYASAYGAFSRCELDEAEFAKARGEYRDEFVRVDGLSKKEKSPSKMVELRSFLEKCTKISRYSEDIMENTGDIVFARMEDIGKGSA